MTKHLPAETYFCRRPDRDHFDVGPYPSRLDAEEEGPAAMGLTPGTTFEIGMMEGIDMKIPLHDIKLNLIGKIVGRRPQEQSRKWLQAAHQAFHEHGEILEQAINLAIGGWLTANDLWPSFGMVCTVTRHVVPGTPEAEPPPSTAAACAKCGEPCASEHWMCDENLGMLWCPACFPSTPCGKEEHGESCPTFVSTIPANTPHEPEPEHEPETYVPSDREFKACGERSPTGRKCFRLAGHEGPHLGCCDKPMAGGGTCELAEGHQGPCEIIPF